MAKSLLAFSFAEAQAGREHTFTGKYYVLGSSAVVTGLPRERATGGTTGYLEAPQGSCVYEL